MEDEKRRLLNEVSRPARMAFEALCGAPAIAIKGVEEFVLQYEKFRDVGRSSVSRNVVGLLGKV